MFQSAAIDVAIALILMYLMLGLLCTVVNEFIATKLKLRAKSLAAALEQLLDNQALRDAFFRHGMIVTNKRAAAVGVQSTMTAVSAAKGGIKSMVSGASQPATAPVTPAPVTAQNQVSYLSSRSVALALIGSLDPTNPLPGFADIRNAVVALPDSMIRDALLSSLTEAGGDLDKLRTSISTWFDDSMERLSGAYKRKLKWISMLIGLIVTVAFNADSFNVATTLWSDQNRRASVVAISTRVAQEAAGKVPESVDVAELQKSITNTENTLRSLPIGWNCVVKRPAATPSATQEQVTLDYWACAKTKLPTVTLIQVLGWILTAAALTLGAPFWFDLLQKFINIRGAGGKPKREDEKATA